MSQIQWFPGHMAKARREVTEKLQLVDVVIELLDARIPISSQNPMIHEITQNKRKIIVLNKADLADDHITKAWIHELRTEEIPVIAVDSQHQKGIKQLQQLIRQQMKPYHDAQKAKGIKPRATRLMIIGIPNVGKSTLINRFVGKNQTQTGNKPGVTKQQRWLKIGKDFELLDTPGILWPKFEDPDTGKKLAITGAIKDSLLHMDDLALYLIDILREHYPETLMERYRLSHEQLTDASSVDLLLAMTRKMNLQDNYDEASERFIFDYRQNRLGEISLDRPSEENS
ncbi:ribosome biogenesis GTPase YlqF [Aerococcaceae bacterium DSM 111020]|nr:ribosome biogenesis GTPase YlqF [Aerococcaceae bacterium DSM 111020]